MAFCRFAIVGVALLAVAAPAWADLSFNTLNDPEPGGSWYQTFQFSSDVAFENVGLVVTPLGDDPAMIGFAQPAWDFYFIRKFANPANFDGESSARSDLAVASGDLTTTLRWETHFIGDYTAQDFLLTAFAFEDNLRASAVQTAGARWNGSEWSFQEASAVTWDEFVGMRGTGNTPATPIPSAAMLALVGFVVVGASRRLRKQ